MKKRLASLIMAVVIFVSFAAAGAVTVSAETAESQLKTSEACIQMLKEFEGFNEKPYWDYAQYTVGYGTRCPDEMLDYYMAYGIPEAEAEALLYNSLNKYEEALHTKLIEKYGLELTQNQFDALILFSYNCGSGWLYKEQDNLRNAIVSNAEPDVLVDLFARWCNAGGQILKPLVRRRLSEANLYLNGVYSKQPPEYYAYVLYDANGGQVSPNIQGYIVENGVEITSVPTYEGYEFQGWFTERIGGTKVEVLGEETRNGRLYAHWKDAEGKTPEENSPADGTKVTICATDLNIRKGPGTNYESAGKLSNGDEVVITEISVNGSYTWGKFYGGWIRLDYTDYKAPEGDEEKPEEKPEQKPVTGTVNVNDFLRIRTGPGTGYSVTGTLGRNDKVTVLEQKIVGSMTWGRIEQGWISMDYVILDKEAEAPEEETTEPTEPEVTEPTEPEATEPTEPEATEPTEPEATEPTEPEATEPTEPEATEPTEPEVTEPTEPEATEPTEPAEPEETEPEQKPSVQTGTVKVNDFLRVRAGAGTSYAIAGYLSPNQKVTILETKTAGGITWGRIEQGWISLDYVVLDPPEEEQKPEPEPEQTPDPEPEQKPDPEPEQKPEPEPEQKPEVTGTVNVSDFLRVRGGPSTSYAIAGYLSPNQKVTILETKKVGATTWGRIEQGWVSMDYIVLDKEPEKQEPEADEPQKPETVIKTVIADCLRVRAGTGTGYSVVGYLYNGAKVEILETVTANGTTWGKIAQGWISLDYVV